MTADSTRHESSASALSREEATLVIGVRRLLARWCRAQAPVPVLQRILQELHRMSDTFNSELSRLRDDVAAQGNVIASATAAFRGLAAQIAAAEASAKAAGATDAQVFSISAVRQTLEANTAALAAAIPANTEAVSVPVSTPTTTAPTTAASTTPESPAEPTQTTVAAPSA